MPRDRNLTNATRRRTVVELDVSYQSWLASGITTYSIAVAEELAADPRVELELCHRGAGVRPEYPSAPQRVLTRWDDVHVRRGRVRLVPHQMRPPALHGHVVVTVHDLIHGGPWSPKAKRLAFTGLMALFRRRRVGIIADSHGTRSRLLAIGFDPQLVQVCQPQLPRAIKVRGSLPVPACGGGGAAYIGNLRPHKDVNSLVQAHAALSTLLPLHVVTSGDLTEIQRLRDAYPEGRAQLLCLHHKASDEERDAVLQHALVIVSPSLEEGYGYAIEEGLNAGTPVIASFIPPHVELADGRDVDLFPPGDVKALTALLASRLAGSGTAHPGRTSALRQRSDLATVLDNLVAAQGKR